MHGILSSARINLEFLLDMTAIRDTCSHLILQLMSLGEVKIIFFRSEFSNKYGPNESFSYTNVSSLL